MCDYELRRQTKLCSPKLGNDTGLFYTCNWYIVCDVHCDDQTPSFTEYEFYGSLKDAVNKYHGDYGSGCIMTSLSVKHFNLRTRIIILRVKRGCQHMIMSTLTFMTKVKDCDVMFHTVHIAGTLKSCQKFLIRYHQKQTTQSLKQCRTTEERNALRKIIKKNDVFLKTNKPGKLFQSDSTDIT